MTPGTVRRTFPWAVWTSYLCFALSVSGAGSPNTTAAELTGVASSLPILTFGGGDISSDHSGRAVAGDADAEDDTDDTEGVIGMVSDETVDTAPEPGKDVSLSPTIVPGPLRVDVLGSGGMVANSGEAESGSRGGIRLRPDVVIPSGGGSSPQQYSDEMYQALRSDLSKEFSSWKKDDFQITPYGFLWGSVSVESHPSSIGSATFWLQPPNDTGTVAYVDYRGTILGTAVEGPKVSQLANLPVTGKVEFDLQRTLDFDNKTTVHLRHCFVEVQNDDFRLLIGQTWDVVSPLMPGTLMYNAGWFSGNSGYRRGQLRGERYFNFSDMFRTKTEFAIAAPFSADVNIPGQITQRSASMPMLQGRIAAVLGDRTDPKKKPMEFGVAAHYVPYEYRMDGDRYQVESHGIFLDMRAPLTEKFGVQGEWFYGQNLGPMLANIGEGVSITPIGEIIGVTGTGGWFNFWYDLTEKTQLRAGWMVDAPDPDKLYTSATLPNVRTLNENFFGNISYRLTKQFLVGFEYSNWRTDYTSIHSAADGISRGNRFDFVTVYGF